MRLTFFLDTYYYKIYLEYLNIISILVKYKWQNMKQCSKCGKTKPTTEFSKCKSNKDGLQYNCKCCNKISNKEFRTEINPNYHNNWYEANMPQWSEYMNDYRRADKGGKIYSITAPDGMVYIGMTEMYMGVRRLEHKKHYQRALAKKRERLPLLHDSFDKYGYENHKWKIIEECPDCTRDEIKTLESSYIKINKIKGISLNQRK